MHTQLMIMADNNPNANLPIPSFGPHDPLHETSFTVSDLLEFNQWMEDDQLFSSISAGFIPQNIPNFTPNDMIVISSEISSSSSSINDGNINRESGSARDKKEIRQKVAFKTESDIEVLDDGFKWRKYGKKMVKNSPNPRNYYRCSVEGCLVKKRVERDKEDSRYVVTTYEGIHNHQGPQM